ncbi:hypothetical protein [Cellulomonas fimi]|uniref:LppX_LprAFG lipoprotein n=1 Tax=Cellulomonas fimi (strain ATCC 484 / DSM 20113 / JCM 1341 / CCUG 24087 / LMG 16345 / NBRC 15513 / NCIMB 8980 / NCTC 7547 / NRS-133) TaxID=590998 RepID=F4H7H7_CELFA|nr:hypothetical protein [Cellulomonas fimi]AEE44534.1 hypothetical protein Celf_0391 [Cellulomonas fimi ATCC 484]NNH06490.1 hypothetical protein [Cellulomonas fimi]VEH26558.1 Uncharacterised protein [Cellulomonas fimi]
MRPRPLVALSATALLAVTLTACSSAEPEPAAASPSKTATATPTPTPTPTVEPLSAANVVARLDAASNAQTSYDTTIDETGSAPFHGTASVDFAGGKRNIAMVGSMPDGDIEIRIVDGLLFVRMPALLGEKYFQVDPADTSNPLAELGTLLDELDRSEFSGMEQAIVSFDPVGAPEDLGGVTVQPYQLVVDTTKIAPEVAAGMLPEGVAALPPTLTYQYWVSDDDLVHKVAYDIAGNGTTITFANYGAGAPVTAPPADQVTTEMPF